MSSDAPVKGKRARFLGRSPEVESIGESLDDTQEVEGGYEDVPLSRVTPDPNNPRDVHLDPANPRHIAADDPQRDEKLELLEYCEGLAVSIRSQGVLTPIRIYRVGANFMISHGECRFIGSILAGKQTIPAIVLREKPRSLRLQQLIENLHKKGLSLAQRVKNIGVVREEAVGEGTIVSTAEDLRSLTGLSVTQCTRYLKLLDGPKDVREAVATGKLTNLKEAYEIACIDDPVKRLLAIKGEQPRPADAQRQDQPPKRVGRPAVVKFSSTPNLSVARQVIERIAGAGRYQVDWTDAKAISKAFKQMLIDLEEDRL